MKVDSDCSERIFFSAIIRVTIIFQIDICFLFETERIRHFYRNFLLFLDKTPTTAILWETGFLEEQFKYKILVIKSDTFVMKIIFKTV